MSGHRTSLSGAVVSSLALLACLSLSVYGASDKKEGKDKTKTQAENPADLFKATPAQEAKEAQERNISAEIEAEVAARAVPVPPQMDLDVDWYSPHIKANEFGKVAKGWVRDDVVLLETDKQRLFCVRRADGVQRWQCELNDVIRYGPAVSRNNVVVNVDNYLVGIEKTVGEIRWRLQPRFAMSCQPLVIDPAAYPKEYTKQYQPLETVFVGGWDGRFYCLSVRGRMSYYVKHALASENFSAPEFSLFYPWHKTHKLRGVITNPIKVCENQIYYAADDQQVYCVSREGDEREPYFMLAPASTGITLTSLTNSSASTLCSLYIGGQDNSIYCLDRLTLKKKWAFAAGKLPIGNIYADDLPTPYLYFTTSDGLLHALLLTPAQIKPTETAESYAMAWEMPGAGVIAAGPTVVYVGLQREKDFPAYKGIAAVEKATGKVLWKNEGGFFTHYLEFQNQWSQPGQAARIFALGADNRLISLKEKVRETGVQAVKLPPPPEDPNKILKPEKKGEKAEEKK